MTLNAYLDGLRHYLHEAKFVGIWNDLAAIARSPVGGNITLSGGRTTLGQIELRDANDLTQTVTDRLGQDYTPLGRIPDPGRDRDFPKYPQGVDFRF